MALNRWGLEAEPWRRPNITELRAVRPDLDAELLRLEAQARGMQALMGRAGCCGVEIAHEGGWALGLTEPGSTVTQCSLGKDCAGWDLPHFMSNQSCRNVMIGGCPACDPESPPDPGARADRLVLPPDSKYGQEGITTMRAVPDGFGYDIPPLPDIVALRAQRPDVELMLALLEDEARAWIARTWPYGGPACFGVRIIHEGDWGFHHVTAESLLQQCSRGVECRGWDLTHRFNEHGCREVLGDCPVCGPAA